MSSVSCIGDLRKLHKPMILFSNQTLFCSKVPVWISFLYVSKKHLLLKEDKKSIKHGDSFLHGRPDVPNLPKSSNVTQFSQIFEHTSS